MIEVKKDKTSVWVLQPKFKVDLRDINNPSSIDEAKALAKALPLVKIIEVRWAGRLRAILQAKKMM